jgi:hypothetical protein
MDRDLTGVTAASISAIQPMRPRLSGRPPARHSRSGARRENRRSWRPHEANVGIIDSRSPGHRRRLRPRQRAASGAAGSFPDFRGEGARARHRRRHHLTHRSGIYRNAPTLVDARGLRLRDASELPLATKVRLEFGEDTKHIEEALSGRRAGIDRLLRRLQRCASAAFNARAAVPRASGHEALSSGSPT